MPASSDGSRANSFLFLVVFLALLASVGPIVTDFYLPALPQQAADFQTSASAVQIGLSATMWGLAVGQLAVGPLSDLYGRKPPLVIGLIVFAAAAFLSAFAESIEAFAAWRFLQGLGASGGMVMSRSIAADACRGRELAKFMGIMGAVQGIAPITAPMLGAFFCELIGWRGIFHLIGLIGLGLALTAAFRLRETLAKSSGRTRPSALKALRVLLGDPIFLGIALQQILASVVLFGHIASSPFIFQEHFGLSVGMYGMLFGMLAFGICAGAVGSSAFSSPRLPLGIGAVVMLAASAAAACGLFGGWPLEAVVTSIFVLLVALGMTLPSAMTIALSRHRERSGTAAAVLGALGFAAGGVIAPISTYLPPVESLPVIFLASSLALSVLAVVMNKPLRESEAASAGNQIRF